MAIDNLSEKCKRRIDPNLDTLGIDERLDIIKVRLSLIPKYL